MQIWPAIDLRGGQCVRLQQGDYERETVFGADPVEMAWRWVQQGARRLHLVDLDGARTGQPSNLPSVLEIVKQTGVPCQLGGGIRDQETIDRLIDAGLTRLVIGTRALKAPEWFAEMCRRHPHRLALGLDARDGRVATDGWRATSEVAAAQFAREMADLPLAAIIYTDIATDGMLAGPNLPALREMIAAANAPLIASGGVTTADDVRQVAKLGAAGCIIGRSLYEGRIDLPAALQAADDVAAIDAAADDSSDSSRAAGPGGGRTAQP